MNITASTLLIKVDDQTYPVGLYGVRQANPNVSFAAEPDEAVINDLGYAVVTPVAQPVGDVVTEAAPELVEGVWTQKWDVRAFTPEEIQTNLDVKKNVLMAQVNTLRDAKLAEGVKFDFGGDFGLLTIQLGPVDCTNILGVRVTADAYVKAGLGETVMGFRTMENIVAMGPATMMVALSDAAFIRVNSVYVAAWSLKDAIKAATTLAELPEVPAELDV